MPDISVSIIDLFKIAILSRRKDSHLETLGDLLLKILYQILRALINFCFYICLISLYLFALKLFLVKILFYFALRL